MFSLVNAIKINTQVLGGLVIIIFYPFSFLFDETWLVGSPWVKIKFDLYFLFLFFFSP